MEMRFDGQYLEKLRMTRTDAARLVHDNIQGDAVGLDANETVFFARELEYVKKRSYDVVYPEYKADFFAPVSNEANTGDDKITYDQFDSIGQATVINDEATDYKNVEIQKKQFSANVVTIGASISWSIQDIRRWAAAARTGLTSSGRSFSQRKIDAVTKVIKQKEEDIVAQGDTVSGLSGFYNNTHIHTVEFAKDGKKSTENDTSLWKYKTVNQITRDFNALVTAPQTRSRSTWVANTVIMDSEHYALLSTMRLGDNTNVTVLDFLLRAHRNNNLQVYAYDRVNLGAASPSGGDPSVGTGGTRFMAYYRNPVVLTQEIPQPIEVLPPERERGSFVTIVRERHAGILLYYPLACARGSYAA